MNGCWVSFTILIVIIVIVVVVGVCCAYVPGHRPVSGFSDVYNEYEQTLNELKESHDIGEPSGVLSYLPDQDECDAGANAVVQDKVAFRPSRHRSGCTYIDKRYPG